MCISITLSYLLVCFSCFYLFLPLFLFLFGQFTQEKPLVRVAKNWLMIVVSTMSNKVINKSYFLGQHHYSWYFFKMHNIVILWSNRAIEVKDKPHNFIISIMYGILLFIKFNSCSSCQVEFTNTVFSILLSSLWKLLAFLRNTHFLYQSIKCSWLSTF